MIKASELQKITEKARMTISPMTIEIIEKRLRRTARSGRNLAIFDETFFGKWEVNAVIQHLEEHGYTCVRKSDPCFNKDSDPHQFKLLVTWS